MKVKRLIALDSWFKPLYILLEGLKNLAPAKEKAINTFVILKFFGLGSITRIAYVIEQLNIPKQKILFITLRPNQSIVKQLGIKALFIDTGSILSLVISVFKCIGEIWQLRRTKILDMERSAYLSGIFRLIVSIGKPCASFFFGSKNRQRGNQTFISLTAKPAINAIAEMLGHAPDIVFRDRATQKERNHEVLVNINAGDYLSERRFPLHQFANLITLLHRRFPKWDFVLTGSDDESTRTTQFRNLLIDQQVDPDRIINNAGKQNLRQFTTRLENSFLFITNDSGPLHLAHYLGTKTVGIWGPTSSHLVGYPDSQQMLNLNPATECAPCFLHPKSRVAKYCNGALTCFESMKTDILVDRISVFVENRDTQNSTPVPISENFLNRDA